MEEHVAVEIVMSIVHKDLRLEGEVDVNETFANLGADSLDLLEVQIDVADTAEKALGKHVDSDGLEIHINDTVTKLTAKLIEITA